MIKKKKKLKPILYLLIRPGKTSCRRELYIPEGLHSRWITRKSIRARRPRLGWKNKKLDLGWIEESKTERWTW